MDKTDSKVRLFLELSHPRQIQIISSTPLMPSDKWNPEIMYKNPTSQYYYAFINDKEVIERVKEEILPGSPTIEIKAKTPIEFNGYSIEDYTEKEKMNNPEDSEIQNSDNNDKNNVNENNDEEKYVIFCRFYLKNFGFIHNFNKLQENDINRLKGQDKPPIVYALQGKISELIERKKKELERQKGENDQTRNEEEKKSKDNKTSGKKLDSEVKDDKNTIKGIDGHWFLINDSDNLDLLSLIKYKEIVEMQNQDKLLDDHSSVSAPSHFSSKILTVNTNNNIINNFNRANDKYSQPQQFSFYVKEIKKFLSIYQNKSCNIHHNKNDFVCKTCDTFCCTECFDSKSNYNIHFGHKIILLEEAQTKIDEDLSNLTERVNYLKTIIENEINEKKNEIADIKNKNIEIVGKIKDHSEKIRIDIKKEEINRANVLYYLGTEAIRIINDFTIKHKYLKILNEKGDMNSYLINYFVFEKIYYKEIKKKY